MTSQITKEGRKLMNILAVIASFSDRKRELLHGFSIFISILITVSVE